MTSRASDSGRIFQGLRVAFFSSLKDPMVAASRSGYHSRKPSKTGKSKKILENH